MYLKFNCNIKKLKQNIVEEKSNLKAVDARNEKIESLFYLSEKLQIKDQNNSDQKAFA